MKKSTSKSLKLEIKPLYEFSTVDNNRQNLSDPTSITIMTVTTVAPHLRVK